MSHLTSILENTFELQLKEQNSCYHFWVHKLHQLSKCMNRSNKMYLGQFTLASDGRWIVALMGRSSQLLSMSTIKLLWQWQWLDDGKKRKLSWLICLSTIVPKLASLLVLTINYFLIKLTGNFWQSSFRKIPTWVHSRKLPCYQK